mmetsp:Transcript_9458/g.38310  ORF Transcript_9458/g.38310 Transcript_9458/m.38310 type:complete len:261 (+) Transcript_9458:1173-1955(+)
MTCKPMIFKSFASSSSSPAASTQGTSATHRTPANLSSVRAYAASATRSLATIASHSAVNAAVDPARRSSSSGTISLAGLDVRAHRPIALRGRNPSRWIPSRSHARLASATSAGVRIARPPSPPKSTNRRVRFSRLTYAPSALAMCLVSACNSVRSLAWTFTALGFLASAAGAKSATAMASFSSDPNRSDAVRTRRRFRDFLRNIAESPSMRSAEQATSSWPPAYGTSSRPVAAAAAAFAGFPSGSTPRPSPSSSRAVRLS